MTWKTKAFVLFSAILAVAVLSANCAPQGKSSSPDDELVVALSNAVKNSVDKKPGVNSNSINLSSPVDRNSTGATSLSVNVDPPVSNDTLSVKAKQTPNGATSQSINVSSGVTNNSTGAQSKSLNLQVDQHSDSSSIPLGPSPYEAL